MRTRKNLEILNRLTETYIVQRRMLERGDDEPSRVHIETFILNQYDRLRAERSEVGAKSLIITATPGHYKPQPTLSRCN